MQFCCTLPNNKRTLDTESGSHQRRVRAPIHNRDKSYDLYNKVGDKRHFSII